MELIHQGGHYAVGTCCPETGRAIGAQPISPEALKSMIDQLTKTLIVDVRDPEEFQKETIRGCN